jgi:hypothetical protein
MTTELAWVSGNKEQRVSAGAQGAPARYSALRARRIAALAQTALFVPIPADGETPAKFPSVPAGNGTTHISQIAWGRSPMCLGLERLR